jgi:hypothetical protein
MNDLVLVDTLILMASLITAATVVIVFFGKGFKLFRRFVHFLDDFHGEDERPGTPRRPGFSERLSGVEDYMSEMRSKVTDIDGKVSFIEKELHPNHGSSMRDAVDRIQIRLDLVEEKLQKHVNN